MTDKLFTYGTLEIPSVVKRVFGVDLSGRAAVLSDYGRYLVRGQSYPAIREEPGNSVHGTLYAGLNTGHFRRLDTYEGEAYEKRVVEVMTEDGERHRAVVYTCDRSLLGDAHWDQAEFIRRHLAEFMASYSGWID